MVLKAIHWFLWKHNSVSFNLKLRIFKIFFNYCIGHVRMQNNHKCPFHASVSTIRESRTHLTFSCWIWPQSRPERPWTRTTPCGFLHGCLSFWWQLSSVCGLADTSRLLLDDDRPQYVETTRPSSAGNNRNGASNAACSRHITHTTKLLRGRAHLR